MGSLAGACLLGLILGARHVFEPDHLAAMATLISTERRSALLGAMWGMGHTATLLLVGGALMVCRVRLPEPLAKSFEAAVAVMLILLGARSLLLVARHRATRHSHSNRSASHADHVALPRRPLLVGMAHGLAGSGALTALALASMPSAPAALLYLILFALGSVVAMSALSGLVGWPLAQMSRSHGAGLVVAWMAGALSVATGLFWGWRSLS